MNYRSLVAFAGAALVSVVPACTVTTTDTTADALALPAVACTDTVDAVFADQGALSADATARGNILKCATEAPITKDTIQAKLTELGYTGKPLTSGARVYRIAYRTERGNAAATPAFSSAAVFIPDTPRAAKLPIVVGARGSRGQAAKCAASKQDPAADSVNPDYLRLAYSLVGAGYPVIVSDLAGYANFGAAGNPPSAFAGAADVARSTLDSGRALKKLFPGLDEKVVIVGHSQGGHSALASLSAAETYGSAGPIAGVAVYAPLWLSQRTWGAVLYNPVGKDFPLAESSAGVVSVWYHYTHAELLDGPGEGVKLFAADKRAKIKEFVETQCWGSKQLEPLATYADELFDLPFVAEVGFPSIGSNPCDPGSVCEKWRNRYLEDRPKITGKAAQTPIFLAYGGGDTTLVPERMKCALDRLKSDGVPLTVCYEAAATHNTIVTARADHVSDWIASVTLGAPAPAACPANETAITAECATPPPND